LNGKLFLDAMEGIRDEYILSAQIRLGYISAQGKRRILSVKQIFTVALAAVLMLLCTVAAAMAVSPEFREAVISLFQLGEVERVPGIPAGANEVKQVSIGGEVSAQYVKADGCWLSDDGETVLRQSDNGQERFWDIHDGQLVELGTDVRETTAPASSMTAIISS